MVGAVLAFFQPGRVKQFLGVPVRAGRPEKGREGQYGAEYEALYHVIPPYPFINATGLWRWVQSFPVNHGDDAIIGAMAQALSPPATALTGLPGIWYESCNSEYRLMYTPSPNNLTGRNYPLAE
jgi:hypothetical protein